MCVIQVLKYTYSFKLLFWGKNTVFIDPPKKGVSHNSEAVCLIEFCGCVLVSLENDTGSKGKH